MRRALVLSGGGARGAFQVGMLRHLVCEEGLDFQIIRGVSIGSINAAYLAQAPTGEALPAGLGSARALAEKVSGLEELWRLRIAGNDSLYRRRPLGYLAPLVGKDSIFTLEPLEHLVRRQVSLPAILRSGRDLGFGMVSLASGEYVEVSISGNHGSVCLGDMEEDEFYARLLASASIPYFFPFARLEEQREALVDGGVRELTPLRSAFRAEEPPDEIYVLLASRVIKQPGDPLPDSAVARFPYAEWSRAPRTLRSHGWRALLPRLFFDSPGFKALIRAADIHADEVFLDDVRRANELNTVAKLVAEVQEHLDSLGRGSGAQAGAAAPALDAACDEVAAFGRRNVPLRVIAPQVWFDEEAPPAGLNAATDFSPELIGRAISHGARVAADRGSWLIDGGGGAASTR